MELGNKVKDKLTDFVGTVIAKADYLYGCKWICVTPLKADGKIGIDGMWFDESRFEVIPQKRKPKAKIKKKREYRSRGGFTPNIGHNFPN